MNPGDNVMARRAAEAVLTSADLCTCPIQVFKLARTLAMFVGVLPNCDCPICNGLMAYRFGLYVLRNPELLDGFHRPGASAMYGPGEERNESLIGPTC